jgi:hypothetical protein
MRRSAPNVTAAALAGLATAVAAGLATVAPARAQDSLETAVKATYLYKFAPFVDWPAMAEAAGAPFAICVVGADPFGSVLDQAVEGQAVDGRPIEVRRMDVISHVSPCRIAYLGGSRAQSVQAALRALRGSAILSVTTDRANPGIVDFVLDGGHLRFRIDDALATECGLRISSKLLRLAVSVNSRQASRANP